MVPTLTYSRKSGSMMSTAMALTIEQSLLGLVRHCTCISLARQQPNQARTLGSLTGSRALGRKLQGVQLNFCSQAHISSPVPGL